MIPGFNTRVLNFASAMSLDLPIYLKDFFKVSYQYILYQIKCTARFLTLPKMFTLIYRKELYKKVSSYRTMVVTSPLFVETIVVLLRITGPERFRLVVNQIMSMFPSVFLTSQKVVLGQVDKALPIFSFVFYMQYM